MIYIDDTHRQGRQQLFTWKVGIIKGTKNLSAAQKFVDFLLSKEGQQIIANNYTLPVRDDVTLPATPGWQPKLTPTRRGGDLYLNVQ